MPATKTTPESEFLGRWWLPWYNPRKHPMQIPTERWDEGECWCLSVNRKWGSHILGVLDLLDQWDTWIGTDDEIEAARIQVNEIKECFTRGTDMGCGCGGSSTPTNITFDENGNMLVSYDGGVTYEPAPDGLDPRYSGPIGAPIPGDDGNDKRCQAAGSATEVMKDQQQQFSNDAGMWSGISGAMAALVTLLIFIGIVGSAGALTPLLLSLAAALLAGGKAAFDAAFNDTVWGIVQCAIYCRTSSDAAPYTVADIIAIRNDIAGQLEEGAARVFVDKTLELWGATGLTNASRAGMISLIDCNDCGCGGCDFSSWEVWDSGVLVSQDASHITVQAVFNSIQWNAGVRVLDINACCCNVQITTDVEGQPTTIGYIPCGFENDDQAHMNFAFTGQSANAFAAAGTVAYTITFTAGEPCA